MDYQKPLRRYLDRKRLSVANLARAARVPRSTINGWLNDGSPPGAAHAVAVSKATGGAVTVGQIAKGARE